MEKVSTYIREDSSFDLQSFVDYYNSIIDGDLKIWNENFMDYGRLPGHIDIDHFLVYVGKRFNEWMQEINMDGNPPVYAPSYSDIILSDEGKDIWHNESSPHDKIPWAISYEVKRKTPLSRKPPFGAEKHLKYKYCGYFKDSTDDNIYEIRMKEWESLIEYTILARSGYEVQAYTRFFESFMSMNVGKFQEAGIAAIIPLGRIQEPDNRYRDLNVHYRKIQYWAHTQEFYVAGPFNTIRNIGLDVEISDMK